MDKVTSKFEDNLNKALKRDLVYLPTHWVFKKLTQGKCIDVTNEFLKHNCTLPNGCDNILLTKDGNGPVFVATPPKKTYSLNMIDNAFWNVFDKSDENIKLYVEFLQALEVLR